METSNIQINEIEYKNFKFTKASYFGYEILINDADKYINITKLLKSVNCKSDWKDIKRRDYYIKYYNFVKEKVESVETRRAELEYKIQGNQFNNHISGTYIHPKLLNFILIQVNPEYAWYVSEIMEQLNNNNIERVQELTEELKNQNKEILNQNKELINKLKETREKSIYEQSDELSNNSKIKLYKLKNQDIYKLSYDQDKDLDKNIYELQEVFIVNAASNILKSEELRKYFNKGIRQFDKSNYDFVINYIEPSLKN